MNVLTIHYNTPELTEAAIRSLMKHCDCNVYVFDNSDKRPFDRVIEGVTVIDNTEGKYVDWDRFLSEFPDKVETENAWGSAKHCKSVDVCMDLVGDGFVLIDSDVLVRRDISRFFDKRYAWVGSVHTNTSRYGITILRIVPTLCYLNVPLLLKNGVRYFNPKKMWFFSSRVPDMYYDTGAWVLEDSRAKGLNGDLIDISSYILHFGHGSWRDKDAARWLEENGELWK